jgi:hypothetical protein
MANHNELPLVRTGQGDYRRDYHAEDIDDLGASAAMLAVVLLLAVFTAGVVVGWLL